MISWLQYYLDLVHSLKTYILIKLHLHSNILFHAPEHYQLLLISYYLKIASPMRKTLNASVYDQSIKRFHKQVICNCIGKYSKEFGKHCVKML